MKNQQRFARAAGVLYLMFAVFSGAVLALWMEDSSIEVFFRLLPSIPGGVELFGVLVALLVISTCLGTWLAIRAKVSVPSLTTGAVVATVSILWNVMAVAFWLIPLGFMVMAYRCGNDA